MQNDYIIINHDTETVLMYFVYVKTSFYVLTIDKEIKKKCFKYSVVQQSIISNLYKKNTLMVMSCINDSTHDNRFSKKKTPLTLFSKRPTTSSINNQIGITQLPGKEYSSLT